jgi:hypothetical protein
MHVCRRPPQLLSAIDGLGCNAVDEKKEWHPGIPALLLTTVKVLLMGTRQMRFFSATDR